MKQKESVKSNLGREFSPAHNMLRDMMLRGYRSKEEYQNIRLENNKYDTYLRQLKTMLEEYPEALAEDWKDGKKVFYFRNQPMKWQNNPLAEFFGHILPPQKEFYVYLTVFQILNEKREYPLRCLYEDLDAQLFDYFDLEEDSQEEEDALEEAEKGKVKSEDKALQRFRRILKKMEAQGLICSRMQDGELIYYLKNDIWKSFSDDELVEMWHYLSFLRNVMPFELPYVLLHKNLELWLLKKQKLHILGTQKEIFLFRHRNPINVIDSEAICGFFSSAKNEKPIKIQISSLLYEYHSPKDWIQNQKISKRQADSTINRKVPVHYAMDDELGKGDIYYNCRTGQISYDKQKGFKTITPKGIRFYRTISSKDGISDIVSTMPQVVKNIFSQGNSVYLQRLAGMCYGTKKEWTEKELKQYFFRGEVDYEEYKDVFERLAPKIDTDYSCFDYDDRKKTYRWKEFFEDVFYIPQFALEAFGSIPELDYTPYFLSPELEKKIQNITQKQISRNWDTSKLHWLEQKSENREERYSDIKKIIMVCFRKRGYIFDTNGKKYDLLRLQYSVYLDEFRLLVRDCVDGSIKFLPMNQADVNKIDTTQVNRRKPLLDQNEIQRQIDSMMKEKTIVFTRTAPSGYLDNQLSEHILMALAGYEHKTSYRNPKPDEQAGEFEIVLKYWPEDEADIENELQLLVKQDPIKESVNLLINRYFMGKELNQKIKKYDIKK